MVQNHRLQQLVHTARLVRQAQLAQDHLARPAAAAALLVEHANLMAITPLVEAATATVEAVLAKAKVVAAADSVVQWKKAVAWSAAL